jgi:hypothetical protein
LIKVYEAWKVRSLVKEFYEKAWRTTKETRRIFEQIGLELTKYAINNALLLCGDQMTRIEKVYAAPIARAGFGLLRPSIIGLLEKTFQKRGIPFETFGLGLSRAHEPDKHPAQVYWNTLGDQEKNRDLSSSLVLVYDMGEASGSTIEGVISELASFKINTTNLLFLLGAASIEQTRSRLEPLAPGMRLVIGSRWRYVEKSGPTQFDNNQMFDGAWVNLPPRDWGRCVSGMTDQTSVKAFIDWISETVNVSKADKATLYGIWLRKIDEKKVTSS